MIQEYDLAIVGGGPVGIYASYFASLHGLNNILIESLDELGGQPNNIYPIKEIKDIPVFNKITGKDLTLKLIDQLKSTTNNIKTNYKVEKIDKTNNGFIINDEINTKSILLTIGNGSFSPKKIPFDYNHKLDNHIHYFIKDLNEFNHKSVAILGGGDSALDWAFLLSKTDATIKLVHRRDSFRGLEETIQQVKKAQNVELLTPFLPKKIELNNDQKINLALKKIKTDEEKIITVDEIIVAYGFNTTNDVIDNWGLENEHGFIKVNQLMESSVPGIYAAGDSVTYEGRVPIIALGFGETQIAITNIVRKIFPDKKMTVHSTSISN